MATAVAIYCRVNDLSLLQTIDNLGDVADSDGEGLTVPGIASLSLNLYRWYLIVFFSTFFIPPLILVLIPDPIYARS